MYKNTPYFSRIPLCSSPERFRNYICWFIFIARQSFVWRKHDPGTNWVVQFFFFQMRLETRPKLRCWWKIDRFFRAFLAVFFQSKSYTFWFPETFRDPLHRLAANKMIVCSRFQSRVSVILPAVVFFFQFRVFLILRNCLYLFVWTHVLLVTKYDFSEKWCYCL